MAIKLGATGIIFHDNSVQTTAGGPVTTLYAIGSYTVGRPQNNTDYPVNSTIAGTSLYTTGHGPTHDSNESGTLAAPFSGVAGAVLVNTGSWRALSRAYNAVSGSYGWCQGLWVRYA
jgi:hypothetical protein